MARVAQWEEAAAAAEVGAEEPWEGAPQRHLQVPGNPSQSMVVEGRWDPWR